MMNDGTGTLVSGSLTEFEFRYMEVFDEEEPACPLIGRVSNKYHNWVHAGPVTKNHRDSCTPGVVGAVCRWPRPSYRESLPECLGFLDDGCLPEAHAGCGHVVGLCLRQNGDAVVRYHCVDDTVRLKRLDSNDLRCIDPERDERIMSHLRTESHAFYPLPDGEHALLLGDTLEGGLRELHVIDLATLRSVRAAQFHLLEQFPYLKARVLGVWGSRALVRWHAPGDADYDCVFIDLMRLPEIDEAHGQKLARLVFEDIIVGFLEGLPSDSVINVHTAPCGSDLILVSDRDRFVLHRIGVGTKPTAHVATPIALYIPADDLVDDLPMAIDYVPSLGGFAIWYRNGYASIQVHRVPWTPKTHDFTTIWFRAAVRAWLLLRYCHTAVCTLPCELVEAVVASLWYFWEQFCLPTSMW